MTNLNFKVKRLPNYVAGPTRRCGDAGFDLCASEDVVIEPGERALIGTGIAASFSPDYYMRISPRSGMAVKSGIDVFAGTVDSSFLGEWKVLLFNSSKFKVAILKGDRIAQAIPTRISQDKGFEFVDELDATDRGTNGFGSSGV